MSELGAIWMYGLPWFLLAFGIVLVIVGALLSGLPGTPERKRRPIDAKMRDADILRELNAKPPIRVADILVLVGLVCSAISIVWRLVLRFI